MDAKSKLNVNNLQTPETITGLRWFEESVNTWYGILKAIYKFLIGRMNEDAVVESVNYNL